MSRSKKSRKVSDIMPARKADKFEQSQARISKSRKPSRYELDLQARAEKKKRKHKGLPTGSRINEPSNAVQAVEKTKKDPRIGSRKKVPLMVEFINQPEKGNAIKAVKIDTIEKPRLSPALELEQLENNECLNQLLDALEAGKKLSAEDQKFVDECLDRIDELMTELGIEEEDNSEEALLRQFENIDINQFR